MTQIDPPLPSRRAVLAGLAALLPSCTTAGLPQTPPPGPRPAARAAKGFETAEAIRTRFALPGEGGFALMDVATGTLIEGHEPDGMFIPASVSKMPTALYALDALGPTHRFVTRLMATGELDGSLVQGDLVLAGGGDPALDTDALGAMAGDAVRLGLTGVSGRFLVDGSALPVLPRIDPGQPEHVAYNPSVGGLNLNFNRIYFEWSRTKGKRQLALEARSARFSPSVPVIRITTDPRSGPVFRWTAEAGAEVWSVAEPALGAKGGRWLPVRDPVAYAGAVFRAVSAAQGLALPEAMAGSAGLTSPQRASPGSLAVLSGGTAPAGTEVSRHTGAELTAVLREMLKHSTNLTAEVVGMAASRARGIPLASLADSGAAMDAWLRGFAGLDSAPRLVNHSGLSPLSRISPRQTVQILAAAERGKPGHLAGLMKPVPLDPGPKEAALPVSATATAKTGTLNFVRGLAGYISGPGGRPLAFAIYAANLAARGEAVADDEEEVPQGSRAWIARARGQERALLRSWAARFSV